MKRSNCQLNVARVGPWNEDTFIRDIMKIEKEAFDLGIRDSEETIRKFIRDPAFIVLAAQVGQSAAAYAAAGPLESETFMRIPGPLSDPLLRERISLGDALVSVDENFREENTLYAESLAVLGNYSNMERAIEERLVRELMKQAGYSKDRRYQFLTAHDDLSSLRLTLEMGGEVVKCCRDWYGRMAWYTRTPIVPQATSL